MPSAPHSSPDHPPPLPVSPHILTWWFSLMAVGGLVLGVFAHDRPFGDGFLGHPLIVFFAVVAALLLTLRFLHARPLRELISAPLIALGCAMAVCLLHPRGLVRHEPHGAAVTGMRSAFGSGRSDQENILLEGKAHMKNSIATVSLSGDLAEKLEAIAAAGFKGVEIFENDLLSFDGTPADVRKLVADLGLEIITFQPFRDFEGMPADSRERIFARAERKFDLMGELGCDLLLVCSNVSPQSLGGIDRAAADLHALGERAGRARHAGRLRGARLGPPHQRLPRCLGGRCAAPIIRRSGSCSTRFHIFARRTDLKPIRAIPRDRIFLVQLADAPLLDMDSLSWSRHFRNFPGQGELPLLDFMDGAAGDRLRRPAVARNLQRSVPRRLGPQRRGRRPALAAVPARPAARAHRRRAAGTSPRCRRARKCLGTEFIEFAIDESEAPRFRGAVARARLRASRACTSRRR